MTTPWTADAYEDFSLSDAKKDDCKRIAMILVHEALRHYQKFDQTEPRNFDAKRWKPIKTANNVTMYRERHPSRRVVKDSYTDSAGWQVPGLIVGNGTISKNIDDVLFGLAYGDEASLLQGLSQFDSPVTNAQILSTIEKPSLEHPYRCTVLQWHAASPSPALRGVVKDRDGVYVRATGILQLDGGERIGYNLMHSLDLPTTPPLEEQGIIRSRISSCVLFKPTSDQSVEVFVKGYYEVIGINILDSIAVVHLATALMDTWASVECAKKKKLSWLLQRKNADKKDVMSSIGIGEADSKSACRSCKKRFGPLRKAYGCDLCESLVCRKCVLAVELLDVIPKLKVTTKKVRLCSTCDQFTMQVNSYKVAQQEILAGRYEGDGNGSTVVEPTRIEQLADDSSAWSGRESCSGEIYDFGSGDVSFLTEGSLSAFAQLTSWSDDTPIIESRRSSDEGSLMRGASTDSEEWDMMIEQIWRSSSMELDLKERERDRQLSWLKMTEMRLRQDESTSVGSK